MNIDQFKPGLQIRFQSKNGTMYEATVERVDRPRGRIVARYGCNGYRYGLATLTPARVAEIIMPERDAEWIDRAGNNLTTRQIVDRLARACGLSMTPEEFESTYRLGMIYSNGGLWYQRIG